MVRPVKSVDLRKGRHIGARFTHEDSAVVLAKAEASGLCLSEFVRNALLGQPLPRHADTSRAEPHGLKLSFAIANELRRVGVNLNQIARLSHMGVERSDELTPLLEDLRQVLASLHGKSEP